jgi:hypothetical protein
MFMHKDDVAKYPKCARLLQRVPGAISGTKIHDAFIEACTMDEQEDAAKARRIAVNEGLRWAVGPMVEPHPGLLKAPAAGEITEACGFFPAFFGRRDRVLVTNIWFKAYEYGLATDQDYAAERLVRTTLHEVVHWVREMAGAADQVLVGGIIRGHHEEAGHYFEMKAYGTANVCTDAELPDAQMTTVGAPPSRERRALQGNRIRLRCFSRPGPELVEGRDRWLRSALRLPRLALQLRSERGCRRRSGATIEPVFRAYRENFLYFSRCGMTESMPRRRFLSSS